MRFSLRFPVLAAILLAIAIFTPDTALAACASPTGIKGEIIYNDDFNTMQFCDDTNWISMGGGSGGGAGITDGDKGDITVSGSGASWLIDDDLLDFTEFSDAMTLDASTSITVSGSNVLSLINTGTGDSFVVNDQASDTTPFVIDAAGNIGIGIPVPTQALDVVGKVTTNSIIMKNVTGAAAPTGTSGGSVSGSNPFKVYSGTAGASAVAEVGTIGTGAGNANLNLLTKATSTESVGVAGSRGWHISARSDAYSTSADQNDLQFFYWNGSTYASTLSLDSVAGNVGIGTTSPGQKLDVSGMIRGQRLFAEGATSTDILMIKPGDDLNPTYNAITVGNAAWSSWPFTVTKAGSVTALAYYHSSDRNLKDNITTVADPFALLDKMHGVHFTWKKDDKPSYGVIAQDVETVMPEAVSTNAEGIKSVEYDQIIAPLIEAVKQLKAENDNLRKEVDALKAAQ